MKIQKIRTPLLSLMAITFLVFLLGSSTLKAHDTLGVKPSGGDWGMVLDVTGLIDNIGLSNFRDSVGNNSLLIKHYRKDDLVYRFGIGIGLHNRKTSTQDSLQINQELIDKDSVNKHSAYTFSFGLEKHLGNSRRLDPYIGVQAIVGIIGKTKIEVDSKAISNTGTDTYDRDYVRDGGGLFGVQLICGFNYFLAERFSLGAEYNLGYNYRKMGGNFSDTEIFTPASGNSSSTLEKGELAVSDSRLSASGTANVTLSYFFGKVK